MADVSTTTVIGPGTRIKGEMTFEGTARILGEFEGKITSHGEVLVAESGVCRAMVEGNVVVVDGVVEGNVTARERLLLNASARMTGDVVATSLTAVEGASLEGHVRIGTHAAGEGSKPRVVVTAGKPAPAPTPGVSSELESSLAGLESKIAGLGRPKSAVASHAAAD